jgi:predicted ATP-grasp superfamily ATP-dependent carboligase
MTTVFVYEDVTATGAGGDPRSPPAPSLLTEGRAMRDAVAADFAAVPGARVVQPGEFPLDRLAADADFTLVIAPECGGRLEHLCREVLRVGGRLLGPSPDAVRLTADKLALARHWEKAGVPTPATWELGDEPADVPVVVKPRDGAGSQATALWERLETCPKEDPPQWPGPMLAQAHVPGLAASVAFLIGPSQTVPLVPCEQLLSADGRFTYRGGRLPLPADLAARATRIATAAVSCVGGLLGYVGVDVVLAPDGRDWAIEINPRLTTSYVGLRRLARFNLAAAMLAVVRGDSSTDLGWNKERIEFTPEGSEALSH